MTLRKQDLLDTIQYYSDRQEDLLSQPIVMTGTPEELQTAFDWAFHAKFEIEMFRRMTAIVNEVVVLEDDTTRDKTAAEAVRDCMAFLIEFQTRTPLTTIGDLLDDFAAIAVGNIPPIIAMLQDVPA